MDLKQEVSLSALKRGKAPAYPVKTSINLVDTQQQRGNLLAQLGLFTIALVVVGISSKLIGCGLGAKLCGFKGRQCVQVGCGMACRGEVALIVANKGMAMNIVNPIFFGPIIILVVCCAVFTPIMLKFAFKGENAYEGMEESKLAENFQLSEQVDEVTARLIEGEKRRQGK